MFPIAHALTKTTLYYKRNPKRTRNCGVYKVLTFHETTRHYHIQHNYEWSPNAFALNKLLNDILFWILKSHMYWFKYLFLPLVTHSFEAVTCSWVTNKTRMSKWKCATLGIPQGIIYHEIAGMCQVSQSPTTPQRWSPFTSPEAHHKLPSVSVASDIQQ